MVRCDDQELLLALHSHFATNNTAWENVLRNGCVWLNASHEEDSQFESNDSRLHDIGKSFYAFMTPIIIITGLIGNMISLKVFTSKVMSRLSSSLYLVALSASDVIVLMTYIFLDWLNHGLPRWPGNNRLALVNTPGFCQAFLFVSYMFRFLSAWLIVIFAFERYLSVCKPQHRKKLCTRNFAKKLIIAMVIFAALVCLYKPILSEVNDDQEEKVCTRNRKFDHINFILDSFYGIVITAVPSIMILFLNLPILKRLIHFDRGHKRSKLILKENKIRLEFTVILLAISTCFICLNLPYFVTWCQQFHQSLHPTDPTEAERISGQLYLTKTIFYVNYSVNFVIYSMTGAYYRREIKSMFRYYFAKSSSRSSSRTTTGNAFGDGQAVQEQELQELHQDSSSTKCSCIIAP